MKLRNFYCLFWNNYIKRMCLLSKMKKKKILSYYEQLNDGLEEAEDIYEEDAIDELEESDEIDSAEAGFMRGYIENE